jgi:hypothetical protein
MGWPNQSNCSRRERIALSGKYGLPHSWAGRIAPVTGFEMRQAYEAQNEKRPAQKEKDEN